MSKARAAFNSDPTFREQEIARQKACEVEGWERDVADTWEAISFNDDLRRRRLRSNGYFTAHRVDAPPPEPKPSTVAYIYVIHSSDGPVKVGKANNVQRRLAQLQTSTHAKLQLVESREVPAGDALWIEASIHQRLDQYRMNGEWFSCGTSIASKVMHDVINTRGLKDEPRYYGAQPPPPDVPQRAATLPAGSSNWVRETGQQG